MDIMAILLLTAILSFLLPGIVFVALGIKYSHSWVILVLFLLWLLISVGFLKFNKEVTIPYFIDFEVSTESVCTEVEKVRPYWK